MRNLGSLVVALTIIVQLILMDSIRMDDKAKLWMVINHKEFIKYMTYMYVESHFS